jgi:hypothetical protein
MKLPRRKFLHLAPGAAALPAVSCFAWAQAYPTRPNRIDRRPTVEPLAPTSGVSGAPLPKRGGFLNHGFNEQMFRAE